ncbi:MAG: hypothetical protein JXD22_07115 [Sedimentisphaerales bacterium]|nr:hypothetical protein [Sedimentisphaerales bacterium]
MSDNHQKMAQAQAASESGLAYAGYLIRSYINDEEPTTSSHTLSQSELTDLFDIFWDYSSYVLDSSPAIDFNEVGQIVSFSEDGLTGREFTIPLIQLNQNQLSRFTLQFRQYDDTPEDIEVLSTGLADSIQRRTRLNNNIISNIPALFDFALFARDDLTLHNGVTINGFNFDAGDDPLQVGTNGIDPGNITLNNSASIDGNVIVGAGGKPDDVIQLASGAEITGDSSALQEEWEPPTVEVPTTLYNSTSLGSIEDPTTITSSGKYDSINLGNSETVTIEGEVTLYITGNIDLGNSSSIEIAEGGKLTLFLGGDLELKNGADINNLTQDATNFMIMGLDTCESIILKNSSNLYASIYASDADVDFRNSSDFYGAVVGNSFIQHNSAGFHYDANLRDVTPIGTTASISILCDGNSYVEF